MRIIPVQPEPDDEVVVPASASRRTFLRLRSRRTFGMKFPSRRTFGWKRPSRRTFGRRLVP